MAVEACLTPESKSAMFQTEDTQAEEALRTGQLGYVRFSSGPLFLLLSYSKITCRTSRRQRKNVSMELTKHVLVVDDEDYIREVVQVSLEIVGRLKVSTACSGKEGLAKAETEQPDAILLDVMMPDIDGLTAFR